MPYKSIEKRRDYNKKYHRAYYLAHIEQLKAIRKEYRQTHKEQVSNYNKAHSKQQSKVNKANWHIWFIKNGYPLPSVDVAYHHIKPIEKHFQIGRFIRNYPCNLKNIELLRAELGKCKVIPIKQHNFIHKTARKYVAIKPLHYAQFIDDEKLLEM